MPKTNLITYLQLHLYELKYNFLIFLITFIYIFLISYYFSNQLIYILVNTLLHKKMLNYFIFTNITEIFLTNLKISFFISTFLTFQIMIGLSWFFLSKGLYKFENLLFFKFYILFLGFNLVIIYSIFTTIIPIIWSFFLNLSFSNFYILTIYFEPKIHTYFNFIFDTFCLIFFIFLYFFLIFLLYITNFLKYNTYFNLRKFFYFQIIILTAIITPPDIFNLLSIYGIFCLFFELIIYLLLYIKKYKI